MNYRYKSITESNPWYLETPSGQQFPSGCSYFEKLQLPRDTKRKSPVLCSSYNSNTKLRFCNTHAMKVELHLCSEKLSSYYKPNNICTNIVFLEIFIIYENQNNISLIIFRYNKSHYGSHMIYITKIYGNLRKRETRFF